MSQDYYIITTNHESLWPRGVLLFWGPDHRGYSSFLEKAGRYSEEAAKEIVSFRGGDYMVPCDLVDAQSVRVVDIDKLKPLADAYFAKASGGAL